MSSEEISMGQRVYNALFGMNENEKNKVEKAEATDDVAESEAKTKQTEEPIDDKPIFPEKDTSHENVGDQVSLNTYVKPGTTSLKNPIIPSQEEIIIGSNMTPEQAYIHGYVPSVGETVYTNSPDVKVSVQGTTNGSISIKQNSDSIVTNLDTKFDDFTHVKGKINLEQNSKGAYAYQKTDTGSFSVMDGNVKITQNNENGVAKIRTIIGQGSKINDGISVTQNSKIIHASDNSVVNITQTGVEDIQSDAQVGKNNVIHQDISNKDRHIENHDNSNKDVVISDKTRQEQHVKERGTYMMDKEGNKTDKHSAVNENTVNDIALINKISSSAIVPPSDSTDKQILIPIDKEKIKKQEIPPFNV